MSNAKGVKRQREKARQEKQATKRERRQGRLAGDGTPEDGADGEPTVTYSQDQVLAELAELHRRYGDGGLSLEDFEEARDELVQ